MTPIAPHIEAFLREHLSLHRGASRHTCDSYAYGFQLLFEFAAARLKVKPSSLMLEQLDSRLVSAFLEHLEDARQNGPETRNVRLAAIKSFFHFLEYASRQRLSKFAAFWQSRLRKPAPDWCPISPERRFRLCLMPQIQRLATGFGIGRCCIWPSVRVRVWPS